MFLDERFHGRAEDADHGAHHIKPEPATDHGGQDEKWQIVVHHAGKNGEDLVGNGRDRGDEDAGETVGVIPDFDLLLRVAARIKHAEQGGGNGFPETPADEPAGDATQHRARSADERVARPLGPGAETHGNEQNVRRNREKGRFGEGNPEQRMAATGPVGPRNGPVVEAADQAGWFLGSHERGAFLEAIHSQAAGRGRAGHASRRRLGCLDRESNKPRR